MEVVTRVRLKRLFGAPCAFYMRGGVVRLPGGLSVHRGAVPIGVSLRGLGTRRWDTHRWRRTRRTDALGLGHRVVWVDLLRPRAVSLTVRPPLLRDRFWGCAWDARRTDTLDLGHRVVWVDLLRPRAVCSRSVLRSSGTGSGGARVGRATNGHSTWDTESSGWTSSARARRTVELYRSASRVSGVRRGGVRGRSSGGISDSARERCGSGEGVARWRALLTSDANSTRRDSEVTRA